MNCLFCEILKGNIPCYKIYEDEKTLAFLDIANDYLGHTLIIPKKHCVNLLDADDETMEAVMKTLKKIANHYINDCGFDGVNVYNCNNESANQSIFHLHLHLIPRKIDDKIELFSNCKTNHGQELSKIVELLKVN